MSILTYLRICAFALVAILARPECVAQQSPEPTLQLFGENIISTGDDYNELLKKLRSPGNGLRDIYKIDIRSLKLTP